jgi:hypothetical protein
MGNAVTNLIELSVSLDLPADGGTPEVRAWIDLEPDIGLDTELELSMRQVTDTEWVGCFTLIGTRPQRFLYRLGLAAEPGTHWSLRVRHRGLQRDILVDGDTLAISKCWFVGSCRVPATKRRRAAGMTAHDVRVDTSREPPTTTRAPERNPQTRLVLLNSYRPQR